MLVEIRRFSQLNSSLKIKRSSITLRHALVSMQGISSLSRTRPDGFRNHGPGSPFLLKFNNHIIASRYGPVFHEGIVTYFGTKENCCGKKEKNLQVEINSDAYPEQTAWKVLNACTNATAPSRASSSIEGAKPSAPPSASPIAFRSNDRDNMCLC